MIPDRTSQLHIPQTTPDFAAFAPYPDYSKSSKCHAEKITRLKRKTESRARWWGEGEKEEDGISESTILRGLGSLRSSVRQLSGQVIHVVISPRISGLLTAREKLSDVMEIHFFRWHQEDPSTHIHTELSVLRDEISEHQGTRGERRDMEK